MRKKKLDDKVEYELPSLGVCFVCEKYGGPGGRYCIYRFDELFPVSLIVTINFPEGSKLLKQKVFMCEEHYKVLVLKMYDKKGTGQEI